MTPGSDVAVFLVIAALQVLVLWVVLPAAEGRLRGRGRSSLEPVRAQGQRLDHEVAGRLRD
jgi:hypothetical protein